MLFIYCDASQLTEAIIAKMNTRGVLAYPQKNKGGLNFNEAIHNRQASPLSPPIDSLLLFKGFSY